MCRILLVHLWHHLVNRFILKCSAIHETKRPKPLPGPFLKNFFYVHKCFASAYPCAPCVSSNLRGLKRTLDDLELELPGGCWELNRGPLQEQQTLLTAEPIPSRPPFKFFLTLNVGKQMPFVLTSSHVEVDNPETL